MPAEIRELFISARVICPRPGWGICSHASGSALTEHIVGRLRAPARMARFACDRHIDALMQFTKKALRVRCVKGQRWRKLHEQHTELFANPLCPPANLINFFL